MGEIGRDERGVTLTDGETRGDREIENEREGREGAEDEKKNVINWSRTDEPVNNQRSCGMCTSGYMGEGENSVFTEKIQGV